MCDAAVIKVYANGKKKVLCGERREGEMLVERAMSIKYNKNS